jgi:L-seryl-tRNA(Ser) seleniumtransferase
MSDRDRLRDLPSVDGLATAVARAELQARREELLNGADAGPDTTVDLVARARLRLRRVLNATGVVVHTNLGRAPLAAEAQAAVAAVANGYCNLELAAATGGAVVASTARAGGGALSLLELPGPAVAIDPGPTGANALAAGLRAGDPAVVGRIQDGRLLLDPRTLTDDEAREVARAVRAVSP